ncbi:MULTISPECIES: hypothetical protein [Rhizobium/Agrobacterium group]|uniref:Uncharacterized protein n=1 Tax=Agrobacterium tomkonis CFBP 6623 TaxID=1183432 RepID=A0A1S7P799_9HYPH|nr:MULTISPECIES: hypothetical protein [Rhizobium/Agrobacterium group]KNY35472.1 hypothetical protein AKG12_06925 [Agrobacterium sp. SUL3]KRA61040.1 hypothetical protein ASD85_10465 [Rhizobium sp. Root651]MCD4661721.1 hypothetical protein [Agrobacterium sp.]QCL89792.1 hypothetical protein CFBP6623_12015 [Agrobacterium tumefaciens]CUX17132.1 Conserved hypothetical protein [Agrobacterium tomkonis CFBP 6623]
MSDRSSFAVPAAIILIAAVSAVLTACASTVMKGYIGAPITSVMLDYGPPDNIYSMGPGQQAYQWRKNKTQVVAGSSSGEVRSTRHGERYEVSETPGYVERINCFYTFYTRSSGSEWYVTSFRQPSLECE